MRTSALPPLTPGMFPRTLRAASLQPLTRFFLQHGIARRVLATADTSPPSACHCEPVRTLVRQSVFPAAIPGKSVVLRANSQLFRIRREELLFGLCCRRSYGLPRRFAPRNDMQKFAACSHCKDALPGQIPTRLCVHPAAPLCTRRSAFVFCIPSRQAPLHPRTRPSFCMSLRASAHTGVAIRSPCSGTWQIAALKANSQWSTNSP